MDTVHGMREEESSIRSVTAPSKLHADTVSAAIKVLYATKFDKSDRRISPIHLLVTSERYGMTKVTKLAVAALVL